MGTGGCGPCHSLAQPQPGLEGQTDNGAFQPLAPEREGLPDRKLSSSKPPPSDASSQQSCPSSLGTGEQEGTEDRHRLETGGECLRVKDACPPSSSKGGVPRQMSAQNLEGRVAGWAEPCELPWQRRSVDQAWRAPGSREGGRDWGDLGATVAGGG